MSTSAAPPRPRLLWIPARPRRYVATVRSLPPHVVYAPQHKCWRAAGAPGPTKKGEKLEAGPTRAEKLLSAPELDALFRVLGADGARCLDAHLCRAAVDEMARCKKILGSKTARPLFDQVAAAERNSYPFCPGFAPCFKRDGARMPTLQK